MHLEKDTETWTLHRLQRQRNHPTIRKTNSSSTTGTTRTSRRCMVQRTGTQRGDCHQRDNFHWLCYRVLGRRKQPSTMEPFRQRGSTYQQPPRGMARQAKKAPKNHAHPNIFVLIELLQKTQANTEANQIQISVGGTQRHRFKKYRNIDNRLTTLKLQIYDGI